MTYFQMTFDPPKKQLDLPSHTVEFRDVFCGLIYEVGQEFVEVTILRIAIGDPSQRPREGLPAFRTPQQNRLVAAKAIRLVHGAGTLSVDNGVVFGAKNEKPAAFVQARKSVEIQVRPVCQVNGTRFVRERIQPVYIVLAGICDMNAGWNGTPKIDLRVHLDPGFGFPECRPGEESQRKVHCRGIQGIHGIVQIDSQLLVRIELSGFPDQAHGHALPNAPVPRFVGVGKRRLRQRAAEAEVVQSFRLGVHALDNISQPMPESELRKCHRNELLPTSKVLYFVIAVVFPDMSIEGFAVNFGSDLGYDVRTCSHGPAYIGPGIRSKASHPFFSSNKLAA